MPFYDVKMGKKKVQSFSSLPNTLKIPGPGSKLLEPSFSHPPLSVNTGTIFFFSREYQTKLQSRLWNCYPRLPSLPVFSIIDSSCWLYKYKTELTIALKSRGKLYYQRWALLEQTFWPGSMEHSPGWDEVPGNSSAQGNILMQTFRRLKLGRTWHFLWNQEVFLYLCFYLHCLFPLSTTDNTCLCFLCLST